MPHDAPFPVIVHPYKAAFANACAFETGLSESPNAVVFIGGLGDGPQTVPYIRTVSKRLEKAPEHGYSVFEIRMRSSFTGFGTSSLSNDVEDISALVKYLRSIGKQKIVLFGHSTGCQDCMEYSDYDKHNNTPVDGFIVQAPVSDREAIAVAAPGYEKSINYAAKMISEGRAQDCVPRAYVPDALGAQAISAYRLHSLFAKGGDDDYFSSDLDDQTVAKFWGRFNKPILVLHSEKDEYVPEHVDQVALNKRYQRAGQYVSPLSGLIPGTGHAVRDQEAQDWLAERVIDFLASL